MMSVLLAALLVGLGIFSVIWAMAARRARRVTNLREVLEIAYLEDASVSAEEAGSLLARTGAATERALAGTGLLTRLRGIIDRSDYRLSAGEFVALTLALLAFALGIGLAIGSPLLTLILAVAAATGPYALLVRSVARRRTKFEAQLPDVLDLVAASLEAGAGIVEALSLSVGETDDPLRTEVSRVLAATALGVPLVDGLREMATRVGSRDLDWTVEAIAVQQRTGGRLADVLRTVAVVMRGREEVRLEVRALTAEGRLSAYILAALPPLFVVFLALVEPAYLRPLYATAVGLVLLVGTTVLVLVSFVAMLRLVKVEV